VNFNDKQTEMLFALSTLWQNFKNCLGEVFENCKKNVAFLLLSVFTDFDNLNEMRLF